MLLENPVSICITRGLGEVETRGRHKAKSIIFLVTEKTTSIYAIRVRVHFDFAQWARAIEFNAFIFKTLNHLSWIRNS